MGSYSLLSNIYKVGTVSHFGVITLMALSFKAIVGIALGFYLLSALLPGAFANFFGADTSGWDAGTIAIWGLLPLLAIIAVAYHYMHGSGANKGA